MKSLFYSLAIVILLASCGDTPSNQRDRLVKKEKQAEKDKASDLKPKEEAPKSEPVTYKSFDAFTVGNGVNLREQANTKSLKVGELANGTLLTIESETERKTLSKSTICDGFGYPWVKVKTATGLEGWLFGKYVYKKATGKTPSILNYNNSTFKFDDESYTFGVAADLSYGMGDDDGFTGCDDYMMPFFYKKGETAIRPIYIKQSKVQHFSLSQHANHYWLLEYSDGRGDDVTRILQILYGARMTYNVIFQEGRGVGEIDILYRKNRFYADLTKYRGLDD